MATLTIIDLPATSPAKADKHSFQMFETMALSSELWKAKSQREGQNLRGRNPSGRTLERRCMFAARRSRDKGRHLFSNSSTFPISSRLRTRKEVEPLQNFFHSLPESHCRCCNGKVEAPPAHSSEPGIAHYSWTLPLIYRIFGIKDALHKPV